MTDDTPSPHPPMSNRPFFTGPPTAPEQGAGTQPTRPLPYGWQAVPQPGGLPPAGPGSPGQPPTGGPPFGPPPPFSHGPGPSHRAWPFRLGIGALAVALALGSGVAGAEIAQHNQPAAVVFGSSSAQTTSTSTAPTEQLSKVANSVLPSVVSINVRSSTESDEGSGIILRSDGVILTNNHVVAAAAGGAGKVTVTFNDGKTVSAHIVGRDPADDLAVVKAEGVSGLTPASFGSAKDLHVGDTVLAIGSPLGLEGSVTSGIVSALNRSVDLGAEENPQQQSPFGQFGFGHRHQRQSQGVTDAVLTEAIQTDAAINPGNSGGPLVNDQGEVVGICTAIATLGSGMQGSQSGSIGVGFAIPIDEAESVVQQLMNGQQPSHALLGVQINDASSSGAQVVATTRGGPAAKAGLQPGDVITKVDSTTITSAQALIAAIRSHQPGDTISVTYQRGGSSHTASVTLTGTKG